MSLPKTGVKENMESKASFNPQSEAVVFHGGMTSPEYLKEAGISGMHHYDNVGMDLPASVGWSGELPSGRFRVSLWSVKINEIDRFYSSRAASIERSFSPDEKNKHFQEFEKKFKKGEIVAPAGNFGKTPPEKVLADEKSRECGLPGERLMLVVDFTREQREYSVLFPFRFAEAVLSASDSESPEPNVQLIIEEFVKNFPNPEDIIFHEINEEIFPDGIDTTDFLAFIAGQTLFTTAQDHYGKDDLVFSQEFIPNLEIHKMLKKPREYYSDRVRRYRIIGAMNKILKKAMEDTVAIYPQLGKLKGKNIFKP